MVALDMDATYDQESDLLAAVKKWLDPQVKDGIKYLPIRDVYTIGYSDLFICVKGFWVVAELKDRTGKASPHQERFIKEMREAGAIGGVCRSVQDVADLVNQAEWRTANPSLSYQDYLDKLRECRREGGAL